MTADLFRQFLYWFTLALMGVTLWVAAWSNQLETQARAGWLAAPAHATTQPLADD